MITAPIVWMLWVGAVGVSIGVRWFIVAPLTLMTGALVHVSHSRRATTGRSIPGSYHGKRAAMVLTLTSEVFALASITIGSWGPLLGLATFRAQFAAICMTIPVGWAIYQSARKAWPAGSDST
ncbi:MAG: hypothetical protein ACMG6S_23330 [Byssovorax sp.]